MTNEDDVPKRVYLVEQTVVTSYYALGYTKKDASDAVYWMRSSGRPMKDAVSGDTVRSERVSWEPGLALQLCPNCPHFVKHHRDNVCDYCDCSSNEASVPAEEGQQGTES